MEIPKSARTGLFKYLGDETDAFLLTAKDLLIKYTEIWRLSALSFMVTDTVNLLFECVSDSYGACVFKLCVPGPEVETEINCLRAYDGKGYVKLWDYSLTDNILLLEQIKPGEQMWKVTDYRERARLVAHTIKNLDFISCERGNYPTYHLWLTKIHKTLTDMSGTESMLLHLNKAIRVYGELKQEYTENSLLHGDMHQENLLLNSQGGYTIIDPKGVVDAPIMETARFLLNETPCEKEKILEIVAIIAPIINIPAGDILKCVYIDAVLGNCWTFEEHFETEEAFIQNKKEALATCEFAYGLIM